ncbi:MAG: class I SAM-dependent methyltransferase [Bryobacteraceae bacterium]|nr:class I SAM-dependent methyltransferase [Bryobacteraceae bacterium]
MKRAWFDELAPRWDTLPGQPETAARVSTFVRKAIGHGCPSVVDAGAGTGVLVPALLGLPQPPALIVELDFAFAMLAENRRKHAGAPCVRWVCGDLSAPPLREGRFDAVLCFSALPHVEEKRAALARLFALLRPGGRLAVGHLMSSTALNAMHAAIGGAVASDELPPAPELAALCESLGARPVVVEECESEYTVVVEKLD